MDAPRTDPAAALKAGQAQLAHAPEAAQASAKRLLAAAPGHPGALLLLGAALRRQGDAVAARDLLVPLAARQPRAAGAHFEAGAALAALGETAPAIAALSRAVDLNPDWALAWHGLGDQLAVAGEIERASEAQARPLPGSVGDRALIEAVRASLDGADAAALARLGLHAGDVLAQRMLAEVMARLGRLEAARAVLDRCRAFAPAFLPARQHRALLLERLARPSEALADVEGLIAAAPGAQAHRLLRAALRVQVADYEAAIADYEAALASGANQARTWLSYGHVLKTVGQRDDALAAYRRSLSIAPSLGEAYWSLANMKTHRFDAAEIGAMRNRRDSAEASLEDRIHLDFALGRALDGQDQCDDAFACYARGAAARRAGLAYDPQANSAFVKRSTETFTADFLAERADWGAPDADPIFVVGLPRSGSTLVEQILASHSKVEGASELPDLNAMARGLAGADPLAYPAALAALAPAEVIALGRAYIERTRVHRKSDRPLFVDKFPGNVMHVGLIRLILPRAKIIDARRHPMACGWSLFTQLFAQGQGYSYDLAEIGRYYADYVALMAHFDQAAPGRVHRVDYERLVGDPEGEVRGLLDHCGLAFEPQCLRFHESGRAVRTASAEQVRQPLYTDGLERWRRYAPWLGPLKTALGPLADG